ncbi:MAG TPA: GNAT family N-acetyltransferase [Actinomycetota bacterium]|nr:GNAT family N-acetyltransferase [Actinomycetota bacterium]
MSAMEGTPPGAPWIEPARLDDIADLARLRWQLYVEQEGEREPLQAYQDRFVAFALQALATDRWHAWVARDAERLVAAMWLQTVIRIPVPGKIAGPIGYLTNVYVAPAHRDGGLGSRMLELVLEWCRTKGFSCVITWPTSRSRPFYRRGGFDRLDEPFLLELAPDEGLNGP